MKRIPASAALIVLAIGVSACGATSRPAATPPSSSTTTIPVLGPGDATTSPTTPQAIDVATIPAQITVPYINAVFAALNHVEGDVTRADLAADSVPPQSLATLRSIYTGPIYDSELKVASRDLVTPRSAIRSPLGDRQTTVQSLVSATDRCVFAITTTTYSQVLVAPPAPPAAEYFQLVPKSSADDPEHLNPTAWAIKGNIVFPSSPFVAPSDPC